MSRDTQIRVCLQLLLSGAGVLGLAAGCQESGHSLGAVRNPDGGGMDSALVNSDGGGEVATALGDDSLPATDSDARVDGSILRDASTNQDAATDPRVSEANPKPIACTGTPVLGGTPLARTGAYPMSVAVADLDGDGNADLATVNRDDGTVSVLLGRGDGRFAARVDYPVGSSPSSMAIGDLDGDGKPDVVVTHASSGTVTVLFGTGKGKLAGKVDYPAGDLPSSVAMADLDGDGNLDVAVSNLTAKYGEATVSVLLGTGAGKLAGKVSYPTAAAAESVAIGDMNGDGHPDLVTADWQGTVSVLLGNGDGTFAAKTDYSINTLLPFALALGDMNRDGRLDVVTINSPEDSVTVLLGIGEGKLGSGASYATGGHDITDSPVSYPAGPGNSPNSLVLADLNGDGWLDIAEANSRSQSVSVLLGTGDGKLASRKDYPTEGAAISLALADVNGDGKPDLVVTNADADTVSVLLGKADGTFAADVRRTDYSFGSYIRSGALGDLNGDGKTDLVVVTYDDTKIPGKAQVLLGNGNGGFTTTASYTTAETPEAAALGDVNRDGKPDLLVANLLTYTVSVFLGTGTGELGAKADFATGKGPTGIVLGDLNGDGVPDIVAPNSAAAVSVLLGMGDGTFADKTDYATGSNPSAVVLGDVNGDKKLDVVAANFSSSSVSVLLGGGDGKLAPKVDYAAGNLLALALGDIDGDGKLDIVGANYSAKTVTVLVGNGDGTFASGSDYPLGQEAQSLILADVNKDGRLDVLAGARSSGTLNILLGTADGKLASRLDYAIGTGSVVQWLASADFNNDGAADLVLAVNGGPVSVMLNLCP